MNRAPLLPGLKPTFRYWMEVEAHVYGFSVAANVLLSFFPFLIVMVSLCRWVLHWEAAERSIYLSLDYMFPDEMGGFLVRNLQATVWERGPAQAVSLFLLLFTANGVFEPLEVALNRIWGAASNRSYVRNQLVSLGLIFACGALAFLSFALTALNYEFFKRLPGAPPALLTSLFFKAAALLVTIFILFLVYWLLPNTRISARRVVPVAILVGVVLEALKYGSFLVWPWFFVKLQREYGPFKFSAVILLWSFLAAMIVLGGAQWAARRGVEMRVEPGADATDGSPF